MFRFRFPQVDTGSYSLYGIVPGVGYTVTIPDPVYHLLLETMAILGANPSTQISDLAFSGIRTLVDNSPVEFDVLDQQPFLRWRSKSSKHLSVGLGWARFSRYSILGTLASRNFAYENREKFLTHQQGTGICTAESRGINSRIERSTHYRDFGDARIYGVKQKSWTNAYNPPIHVADVDNASVQWQTNLSSGFRTVLSRAVYGTFLCEINDVFAQLMSIGLVDFGAGSSFPAVGTLGPGTSGIWSRVRNFHWSQESDKIDYMYDLETWQNNGSNAEGSVYHIKFTVDMTQPRTTLANPYCYTEELRRGVRCSYSWSRDRHRWTRFHSSYPPMFYQGVTTTSLAPSWSSVKRMHILSRGVVPFMLPRKRAIVCDQYQEQFERECRASMDDPDLVNAIYDEYMETIETDLRNLTPTNALETAADMRELQGLIPDLKLGTLTKGSLWDRLKAMSKVISSGILYNNFIFNPTVGEVEVYTEAVKSYVAQRTKQLTSEDNLVYTRGSVTRVIDANTDVRISIKSCWMPPPYADVLERLGADILRQASFSNYYDTIPFSWLLDYFSNLGDTIARADQMIHNLNAWPLYTVQSHKFKRYFEADSLFTSSSPNDKWSGVFNITWYDRKIVLEPLYPALRVEGQNNLTASRLSNIGAVVVGSL